MRTDGVRAGEWLAIAQSPYFIVEKGIVSGPLALAATEASFVILVVAAGNGAIRWDNGSGSRELPLRCGQCLPLPANLGEYELDGEMTILRSTLP